MKTLFTVFFLLSNLAIFGQVTVIKQGFINEPSPTKSCHASTIIELADNQLLAAWFGGEYESHPQVCIWLSFYKNGVWSSPQKIADGIVNEKTQYATWNPVLFKNSAGKLFLFYKVGKTPRDWWGMMKTSADDGKNWSEAIRLPNDMLGAIKNKPIELPSGEVLHPTSTEVRVGKKDIWKVHIEKSDAEAKNWQKIEVDCGNFGVIQPTFLVHENGKIQMLMRSRQSKIVESWSADEGKTWSKLEVINLPNPNSSIESVKLNNGQFLLIYNPLKSDKSQWGDRNVLKVGISTDGKNWKEIFDLENTEKGEYSYPSIIQTKDGLVHITYTHNRLHIKHVVLKMD